MQVPIRLYRRSTTGEITDHLEPGESGSLLYGAGAELVDALAEFSGVAAYLRQRQSRAEMLIKAVEQAEVEDKAVDKDEVEDKGLSLPERPRGTKR